MPEFEISWPRMTEAVRAAFMQPLLLCQQWANRVAIRMITKSLVFLGGVHGPWHDVVTLGQRRLEELWSTGPVNKQRCLGYHVHPIRLKLQGRRLLGHYMK